MADLSGSVPGAPANSEAFLPRRRIGATSGGHYLEEGDIGLGRSWHDSNCTIRSHTGPTRPAPRRGDRRRHVGRRAPGTVRPTGPGLGDGLRGARDAAWADGPARLPAHPG